MRSSFFGNRRLATLITAVSLLLAVVQAGAESTHVTKGSKAASLQSCVAPTDEIRRNHMDYLKHERDFVVRFGDRSGKYKIAECIDCHAEERADGSFTPVNEEGQFCDTCHDYVAVELPCFDCHRTTPEKAKLVLHGMQEGHQYPMLSNVLRLGVDQSAVTQGQ